MLTHVGEYFVFPQPAQQNYGSGLSPVSPFFFFLTDLGSESLICNADLIQRRSVGTLFLQLVDIFAYVRKNKKGIRRSGFPPGFRLVHAPDVGV